MGKIICSQPTDNITFDWVIEELKYSHLTHFKQKNFSCFKELIHHII